MFARFAKDEGGASAAEFALISPLFITLLFGIFQLGWALHCASSVRYALEESARTVMLNEALTASDVETAMRDKLARFADPDIAVDIVEDSSQAGMELVHLNATYVHQLAVPFLPEWELTFQQTASVARPT